MKREILFKGFAPNENGNVRGGTMKVKVDIINLFNRAIENLLKDRVCPHCEEIIETDYETVSDTSGIYTGFQIVTKYLQEIAERAVKIEDAVILECLLNLKCISGTEDNEKESK